MVSKKETRSWSIVPTCVLLCNLVWLVPNAHAQQIRETKLMPDGLAEGDQLGYSVSVSGDYVLLGNHHTTQERHSGVAYIFGFDGTTWDEGLKLMASDGDSLDAFGFSVFLSTETAFIGAPGDDDGGEESGAVYVFKRDGETWREQSKFITRNGNVSEFLGSSISVFGDYALVGAPGNDDNGNDSGAAYIFKQVDTTWVEQAKLTASDGFQDARFGHAASLSGDYAAVTALSLSGSNSNNGALYIFHKEGDSWIEEIKLTSGSGGDAEADGFGRDVALSNDLVFVGAPRADDNGDNSGAIHIFEKDGETWSGRPKLLPDDNAESDFFGFSVALSDDYAVIGAPGDDGKGSGYLYKHDGGNWVEQIKFGASDGDTGDSFGVDVALSDDFALVGAWLDSENGLMGAGSAYVYSGFSRPTDVEDLTPELPVEWQLRQNYPNPFNPSTTIRFTVPEGGLISLAIFNGLGQKVKTLHNGHLKAGYHVITWDGTDDKKRRLSSGIYFYQLETGNGVVSKKMLLLR